MLFFNLLFSSVRQLSHYEPFYLVIFISSGPLKLTLKHKQTGRGDKIYFSFSNQLFVVSTSSTLIIFIMFFLVNLHEAIIYTSHA